MAAAGLQWKYFFAAFGQKRLQRKAGTKAQKSYRCLKPQIKTAMKNTLPFNIISKNYLAMFTALFSLITVTFI